MSARKRKTPEANGIPSKAREWDPGCWRAYPAMQMPQYADEGRLSRVEQEVRNNPPLVFAGEVDTLTGLLARVSEGRGFVLQAGDCAESFRDHRTDYLRDTVRLLLQMSVVLTYATGVPVVKLARMAGQYAKPRSAETEEVNGETLPVYRGDIVNGIAPDVQSRQPDPGRITEGYFRSAATINLMRAFASGGYADLHRVHSWNLDFIRQSAVGKSYEQMAGDITRALRFMGACGVTSDTVPALREVSMYTSHEALLLPYEEAMTRQDSISGRWYNTAAHGLWVGDRTRDPDHAHVRYLSGVRNPLGIKCGPTLTASDLVRLLDILNPDNEPGRIMLICRFGHDKIGDHLPRLIRSIQESGARVVWSCDPMHGNTKKSSTGYKTRLVGDVLSELRRFFDIHAAEGTYAGGVHLELTGQDVTECTGGGQAITDDDLSHRYHTACDPRLNAQQSLEVAFALAELMERARSRFVSGD